VVGKTEDIKDVLPVASGPWIMIKGGDESSSYIVHSEPLRLYNRHIGGINLQTIAIAIAFVEILFPRVV